jgi:tetratricopeptide (TPR) repeat protein
LKLIPVKVYIWDNKGYILLNQRKYDEALKCFDRAIQLEPLYGVAWSDKGTALYYQKKYKDAVTSFNKALSINPEDKVAKDGLAQALKATGQ